VSAYHAINALFTATETLRIPPVVVFKNESPLPGTKRMDRCSYFVRGRRRLVGQRMPSSSVKENLRVLSSFISGVSTSFIFPNVGRIQPCISFRPGTVLSFPTVRRYWKIFSGFSPLWAFGCERYRNCRL
jgi:hypothetical protein